MKNLLIYSLIILAIIGCKDSFKNKSKTEIIRYKGMDGQSVYLCFISPKIGYSFNNKTITDWDKVTDEQLDDPNYFPKSTDEATIYKTTDGGKNWVKINSIKNRKFDQKGIFYKESFYIRSSDFYKDKLFLLRKDVFTKTLIEKPINTVYNFFVFNNKVHFTSNKYVNIINEKMNIIDSCYVNLGNEVLPFKNKIYTIVYNEDGFANFEEIDSLKDNKIKLPIIPANLAKQDKNTILIAGNTINDDNEISLVSYDVNTKQSRIIKRFKNYSIIQDLQSNDKAIVGFIGNIKGAFTEYDMFYSLDKGKTWNLHKLEDRFSIKPNCLLDNVLYINGGVITKIYLQ